ncbi:Uncharacterised protein [Salmonella enterica subsp. houtenae]|nr:Uncharacterised protein [Salmonella enterica subsp. houtenae]
MTSTKGRVNGGNLNLALVITKRVSWSGRGIHYKGIRPGNGRTCLAQNPLSSEYASTDSYSCIVMRREAINCSSSLFS